jgi:RNA polymerase sigma-70 factor, ECF subfamily
VSVSAAIYDENRGFLWGLCYRMTGSASDAEEIVQEAFVRALEKPPADTTRPMRPWLVRVAVNLCRDLLRHRRRTEYVGPWLPSPVPSESLEEHRVGESEPRQEDSSSARYEMRESVSFAFLLTLEALKPAQRAVLLLRDVFDYSTEETAAALSMSEANVKVTLHRARRLMREYDKARRLPSQLSNEAAQRVLEKFLRCLEARDAEGLERLLAEDVVVVSDGGGEVTALLEPMRGRAQVLRLVTKLYEAYRKVTETSFCELNNEPAVLIERWKISPGHASRYTMHCKIDEAGRIERLDFVFAPSKLTALKVGEMV